MKRIHEDGIKICTQFRNQNIDWLSTNGELDDMKKQDKHIKRKQISKLRKKNRKFSK